MRRADLDNTYSLEALEAVAAPGGYTSPGLCDSVTGRLMSLSIPGVPLALADHILWAHSDGRSPECFKAPSWDATLADLAQDLLLRCNKLEQRLAARP